MSARASAARVGVRRRMVVLLGAALVVGNMVGCGGNSASSDAASLPGPLGPATDVVNQIQAMVPGLNAQQVAQGLGGILGYARTRMPASQYQQAASAFPASNALVAEGTKLGKPSEMTGLSSLRGTLSKAGINQEQYSQLVSATTKVVSDKAGPEVGQAFAAVFR